jgi:hypothetical protein
VGIQKNYSEYYPNNNLGELTTMPVMLLGAMTLAASGYAIKTIARKYYTLLKNKKGDSE